MFGLLRVVKAVSDFCFVVSRYLCAALLVATTVVIFAQVILRYVFNQPLMWAESLVKIFLVVLCFLSAGIALLRRDHMNITLVTERFPLGVQRALTVFFDVVVLAVFVMFTIFGYQAIWVTPGFLWEFGNLPKMYLIMLLPVCGIFISVQALYVTLQDMLQPGSTPGLPQEGGN